MRTPVVCMVLMLFLFMALPSGIQSGVAASGVVTEDYDLYDRIVEDKFLTSQIQLVLLEHLTVARLVPDRDDSMTLEFFQQADYFDGELPQDLIRDFIDANHARTRLEGRFRFGVRYRFVSEDAADELEASTATLARHSDHFPMQTPVVLDRLAFSRVGRTLKNDQALVYVEHVRRDGTGAGFLVWFHRPEQEWVMFDTEVVWTIRDSADG